MSFSPSTSSLTILSSRTPGFGGAESIPLSPGDPTSTVVAQVVLARIQTPADSMRLLSADQTRVKKNDLSDAVVNPTKEAVAQLKPRFAALDFPLGEDSSKILACAENAGICLHEVPPAGASLYRGTFGGKPCLVKFFKDDAIPLREMYEVIRKRQHDNLPTICGFGDSTDKLSGFFAHPGYFGSVHKYMSKKGPLPELHVARVVAEVSSAIAYLHLNGIVLVDIRLNKIHFKSKDCVSVVIADLDGAASYDRANPMTDRRNGSPNYIAPEILTGASFDPTKADVWMLGVATFTMLCGQNPFQDANSERRQMLIINAEPAYPQRFPERMRPIIAKLLDKDPKRRPTADNVAEPMRRFLSVNKRKAEGDSSSSVEI